MEGPNPAHPQRDTADPRHGPDEALDRRLVSTESDHHPLTILLVEDHEAAAEALGGWLMAMGHRVTVCNSGGAALDTLQHEVPDLALIDLGLPDVAGATVAARLRDVAGKRAHCFAVTGRPFLEPGTARLFDGVFEKPLDVDVLRRVLETCSTATPEANPRRA